MDAGSQFSLASNTDLEKAERSRFDTTSAGINIEDLRNVSRDFDMHSKQKNQAAIQVNPIAVMDKIREHHTKKSAEIFREKTTESLKRFSKDYNFIPTRSGTVEVSTKVVGQESAAAAHETTMSLLNELTLKEERITEKLAKLRENVENAARELQDIKRLLTETKIINELVASVQHHKKRWAEKNGSVEHDSLLDVEALRRDLAAVNIMYDNLRERDGAPGPKSC
jgi:ABC-type Fe3+/spermidine/putrescine transport system ATPase subunit